jgi:hypothetical protein
MDFEDFWKNYPHPKNRGSKAHAEKLYGRLSVWERVEMLSGLGKYQAYLAENTWNAPMQAQRWLNKDKKNWQSWTEAAEGEDGDIRQIQQETAARRAVEAEKRRLQAQREAEIERERKDPEIQRRFAEKMAQWRRDMAE